MFTDRAIEPECQQHHEEDKRPEDGARHRGDGGWVYDKHESWTFGSYFLDGPPRTVGHVPQHGEDDEPCDETGTGIDDTRQQGVPAG